MSALLNFYSIKNRHGGPAPLPEVPKLKLPPVKELPPLKKIEAPSAPPTQGVATSNAFKADEKRRILAGLPKKTENTYAGDTDTTAPIKKKTLLGGGISGRSTTGE